MNCTNSGYNSFILVKLSSQWMQKVMLKTLWSSEDFSGENKHLSRQDYYIYIPTFRKVLRKCLSTYPLADVVHCYINNNKYF